MQMKMKLLSLLLAIALAASTLAPCVLAEETLPEIAPAEVVAEPTPEDVSAEAVSEQAAIEEAAASEIAATVPEENPAEAASEQDVGILAEASDGIAASEQPAIEASTVTEEMVLVEAATEAAPEVGEPAADEATATPEEEASPEDASAEAMTGQTGDELLYSEGMASLYQNGEFPLTELASQPMLMADDTGDVAGATAAILAGLKCFSESINVEKYNISSSTVVTLYANIINNNPGLFFVTGGFGYNRYSDGTVIKILPYYNEYASATCVKTYENAVSNVLSECITSDMSDFQKALALHEYLATHMQYDFTYTKRNAYDALINGEGVCQGYTMAYHDLLNRLDIESDFAESDAMNHIWNIVKINGKWYHVDVTWDDPSPNRTGRVFHTSFMKSDNEFNSEGEEGHHDWVAPYACDSTTFDSGYYWQNVRCAVYEHGDTATYIPYTTGKVQLIRRTLSTGTEITLVNQAACWKSDRGQWVGTFTGLSLLDGEYYFNNQDQVYCYTDEGEVETVYTDSSNLEIYGSTVFDYGKATLDFGDVSAEIDHTSVVTLKVEPKALITFDANGGTVSPTGKSVCPGQTLGTLPTPTRENYTFQGWYTAKVDGTKVNQNVIIPTAENRTLYAHWTGKVFTVTLSAPGATLSLTSKSVRYGNTYGAFPRPSKTGYSFQGWYTAATGGTKVTADSIVKITANQTLYAHWTGRVYTVKLSAPGATLSLNSKNVRYGSTYGAFPRPTKTGYSFQGWYTSATGGTKVTAETVVKITANQTLYARWAGRVYTVKLSAPGAKLSLTSKNVRYDNTYGAFPRPSKTGYSFQGWYTAATGGTKVTADTTVKITENQTLYAHWAGRVYNVKLSAPGANLSLTNKNVRYGNTYGAFPRPSKSGYTFLGWYTSEYGGSMVTAETPVTITANQTLYAHWKQN